jgi:hypothetical protein
MTGVDYGDGPAGVGVRNALDRFNRHGYDLQFENIEEPLVYLLDRADIRPSDRGQEGAGAFLEDFTADLVATAVGSRVVSGERPPDERLLEGLYGLLEQILNGILRPK